MEHLGANFFGFSSPNRAPSASDSPLQRPTLALVASFNGKLMENMGKCGEIWENARKYGKMMENVRNVGKCGKSRSTSRFHWDDGKNNDQSAGYTVYIPIPSIQ
jgi:hypothetical protein